jgi:hypothetical protein
MSEHGQPMWARPAATCGVSSPVLWPLQAASAALAATACCMRGFFHYMAASATTVAKLANGYLPG